MFQSKLPTSFDHFKEQGRTSSQGIAGVKIDPNLGLTLIFSYSLFLKFLSTKRSPKDRKVYDESAVFLNCC